jgi:hypothetical protein
VRRQADEELAAGEQDVRSGQEGRRGPWFDDHLQAVLRNNFDFEHFRNLLVNRVAGF